MLEKSEAEWDLRMKETRYLFRVFKAEECASPFDEARGFTAYKFRNNQTIDADLGGLWATEVDQYELVPRHVDGKNVETPWISTTRYLPWALWYMRAPKRKRLGAKLAVIDLHAPALHLPSDDSHSKPYQGRILHAQDALAKSGRSPKELIKLQKYSAAADEILVFGQIPTSAVVSVVTLGQIPDPVIRQYFPKAIWRNAFGKQVKAIIKATIAFKSGEFTRQRVYWTNLFHKQKWDPAEFGRVCAETAHLLLQNHEALPPGVGDDTDDSPAASIMTMASEQSSYPSTNIPDDKNAQDEKLANLIKKNQDNLDELDDDMSLRSRIIILARLIPRPFQREEKLKDYPWQVVDQAIRERADGLAPVEALARALEATALSANINH